MLLALVGCGLGVLETEHMNQIQMCLDLCDQAVDEAVYAEGSSFIVATSNLRCRCQVERGGVRHHAPAPMPTPGR